MTVILEMMERELMPTLNMQHTYVISGNKYMVSNHSSDNNQTVRWFCLSMYLLTQLPCPLLGPFILLYYFNPVIVLFEGPCCTLDMGLFSSSIALKPVNDAPLHHVAFKKNISFVCVINTRN